MVYVKQPTIDWVVLLLIELFLYFSQIISTKLRYSEILNPIYIPTIDPIAPKNNPEKERKEVSPHKVGM